MGQSSREGRDANGERQLPRSGTASANGQGPNPELSFCGTPFRQIQRLCQRKLAFFATFFGATDWGCRSGMSVRISASTPNSGKCWQSRPFGSPSPQPSPSGRGRILRRGGGTRTSPGSPPFCSAKVPNAELTEHAGEFEPGAGGCPLSPGERVRVRGQSAFESVNRPRKSVMNRFLAVDSP